MSVHHNLFYKPTIINFIVGFYLQIFLIYLYLQYKIIKMKIVVKNIKDGVYNYLVYLKTDDDVLVSAEFATSETLDHIIEDLSDDDDSIKVFFEEDEKEKTNEQPIVLVFYLNRELMSNREIIQPFVEAVNQSIAEREANMMAFFLPTDDQERVDCINPLLATPDEKTRISEMIDEISKNFDVGQGADDYDDVNIINTRDDD